MLGLFQELEGDVAILVSKGTYYQVPMYVRDGWLFAKWGGGFVRLMKDGATTKASVRIETLHFDRVLYADALGRLAIDIRHGGRLDVPHTAKLLGSG